MTADLFLLSALLFGWWYALRPKGVEAYHQYLQSPGWALTKVLRKQDKCRHCKSATRLELHHVSYKWHNRLGLILWLVPNVFDPMKTLCRACHGREHKKG